MTPQKKPPPSPTSAAWREPKIITVEPRALFSGAGLSTSPRAAAQIPPTHHSQSARAQRQTANSRSVTTLSPWHLIICVALCGFSVAGVIATSPGGWPGLVRRSGWTNGGLTRSREVSSTLGPAPESAGLSSAKAMGSQWPTALQNASEAFIASFYSDLLAASALDHQRHATQAATQAAHAANGTRWVEEEVEEPRQQPPVVVEASLAGDALRPVPPEELLVDIAKGGRLQRDRGGGGRLRQGSHRHVSRLMRDKLRSLAMARELEVRSLGLGSSVCTAADLSWPQGYQRTSNAAGNAVASSSASLSHGGGSQGAKRRGPGDKGYDVDSPDSRHWLLVPARCSSLDLYNQGLGDGEAALLAAALKRAAARASTQHGPSTHGSAQAQQGQPSPSVSPSSGPSSVSPRLLGLERLNLARNSIGPEGAAALASALRAIRAAQDVYMSSQPAMALLDLNSNLLGDDGAVALASGLLPADMNAPKHGHGGDKNSVEQIIRMASTKKTSLTLVLHNNGIGDRGAIALAAALAKGGGLKGLLMANNFIGDAGAEALAMALNDQRLWPDDGSDASSDELSEADVGRGGELPAVVSHSALSVLHLGSNRGLGDRGAAALGRALALGASLEQLSLSGCPRVGDEGAAALASGAEKSPALGLSALYLSSTSVGSKGAEALLSALETTALGVVGLRGNAGVTPQQLARIQQLTLY